MTSCCSFDLASDASVCPPDLPVRDANAPLVRAVVCCTTRQPPAAQSNAARQISPREWRSRPPFAPGRRVLLKEFTQAIAGLIFVACNPLNQLVGWHRDSIPRVPGGFEAQTTR